MSKKKETVVCTTCGSEDITCDANAHWDNESQEFLIGEVWEKGAYCGGCDCGDARWEFKEIIDGKDSSPDKLMQTDPPNV